MAGPFGILSLADAVGYYVNIHEKIYPSHAFNPDNWKMKDEKKTQMWEIQ